MQRRAFQLRVRAEYIGAYEDAHRHVWPELLRELESFGVRNYSIFRRGQDLFLYMHVQDFDVLLAQMAQSEVNRRWQAAMEPFFEPVPSLEEGESFAMMEEIFFMPGAAEASDAE